MVPRAELPGIDGVRQARLPIAVRAARRPKEVPKERRPPGVHVRASLDEHDGVVLSNQAVAGPREDRGHGNDPQGRSFTQIAAKVGRVLERRNRQDDVVPEDLPQVLDVDLQEGFGARVVRAVVPDDQDPWRRHQPLPRPSTTA